MEHDGSRWWLRTVEAPEPAALGHPAMQQRCVAEACACPGGYLRCLTKP